MVTSVNGTDIIKVDAASRLTEQLNLKGIKMLNQHELHLFQLEMK